jgi:hypothetical protein
MLLVRQVVADSQGHALPSRSTPTTASMDIFWRSRWHLNTEKQCKTSVRHKRPPTARKMVLISLYRFLFPARARAEQLSTHAKRENEMAHLATEKHGGNQDALRPHGPHS